MFLHVAAHMAKAKKQSPPKISEETRIPTSRSEADRQRSGAALGRTSTHTIASNRRWRRPANSHEQMPFNPLKPAEFDGDALAPPAGEPHRAI